MITIYEGQSKISESCFISDKLLIVWVVFVLLCKFKTFIDIIVYFPTIQVFSETVARQRKVIQAAPAFAVILPVFKPA